MNEPQAEWSADTVFDLINELQQQFLKQLKTQAQEWVKSVLR